jgi:septal ring factor EnvC (AmiA/AmiB activator)
MWAYRADRQQRELAGTETRAQAAAARIVALEQEHTTLRATLQASTDQAQRWRQQLSDVQRDHKQLHSEHQDLVPWQSLTLPDLRACMANLGLGVHACVCACLPATVVVVVVH